MGLLLRHTECAYYLGYGTRRVPTTFGTAIACAWGRGRMLLLGDFIHFLSTKLSHGKEEYEND